LPIANFQLPIGERRLALMLFDNEVSNQKLAIGNGQ